MYSTNLWIFSFYLAFATSLCFYFLLFIYFFISVKPCLLIYGIILFSSCVASLLSEGGRHPKKTRQDAIIAIAWFCVEDHILS